MDSDDFFEEEIDSECFAELDAIEAAHYGPHKATVPPSAGSSRSLAKEDSFVDLSFDIDEAELQRIDEFVERAYKGTVSPVVRPVRRSPNKSRGSLQKTLFGDILPSSTPSSSKPPKQRSPMKRTKSTHRSPFGQQAPKTKQWDRTQFAKSGLKATKPKSKGKGKAKQEEELEVENEMIEFEQFPAPFVSGHPPPPMKLKPDLLEAKHWIYPLNKSKRDYQFNIVKHCLFENTLVSLPTGLGKTFIAGVVMLNYYRWFPEGKVVFVAPSKPLVAQQVEACHQTCGIPGVDAVELTGNIPRAVRAQAWNEKRIFYMTPQTLVNDLVTENCDYRHIILLVVDEAHRGIGDYAYAQVVRFLMAKNPHFRVLALTATPGSTPDAVQAIIDSLHISRIEIRDENSLDLKEYVFKKNINQHVIKMSEDVNKVKDLLAKLMQDDIKQLRDRGVMYGSGNPVTMHPYLPQASMQSLKPGQRWACGPLSRLSSLARAMSYLMEASMGMCRSYLQELASEKHVGSDSKKQGEKAQKLRSNPKFQAVMEEIELQYARGFSLHPKMETLKALMIQHFGSEMDDDSESNGGTRAMVFVTYRECVDEIVDMFSAQQPLIRAIRFVGQGTDKQGKRGYGQKEQLEVINKFKQGQFNVLVATSVGEEGLDIGEVDLIVCYDAQKTPIRMLQRVGRTGRKREGHVHVLLSEEREEFNLDKAKATYKDVQKSILRGDQLELYADVERLLPDHVKPECLEKVMEIVEYNRKDGTRKFVNAGEDGYSTGKIKKRKRNDDMMRNIPTGASTGFVSVAQLLVKDAKSGNKKATKDFDVAGQDDDTDEDLETGRILPLPRRTVSGPAANGVRNKKVLRRSSTMREGRGSTKWKIKEKQIPAEPTLTQFMKKGVDDSDDMEIENNTGLSIPRVTSPLPPGSSSAQSSRSESVSAEIMIPVIELTSSDNDPGSPPSSPILVDSSHHGILNTAYSPLKQTCSDLGVDADPSTQNASSSHQVARHGGQDISWLVDSEDEDPSFEIIDSSPAPKANSIQTSHTYLQSPKRSLSPIVCKHGEASQYDRRSVSDSYISSGKHLDQHAMSASISPHTTKSPSCNSSVEYGEDQQDADQPAAEDHSRISLPGSQSRSPQSSFPVHPKGKRRRNVAILHSSSPPESPAVRRRVERERVECSPAPPAQERRKLVKPSIKSNNNVLFDTEAVHSGDEVSAGSSHSGDDIEDEHDRSFLQDSPMTLASSSYDQSLVYRQSLLTQISNDASVPKFATRPFRRRLFGRGENSVTRHPPPTFYSPTRSDGFPDEYSIGSFVVNDDEEIA